MSEKHEIQDSEYNLKLIKDLKESLNDYDFYIEYYTENRKNLNTVINKFAYSLSRIFEYTGFKLFFKGMANIYVEELVDAADRYVKTNNKLSDKMIKITNKNKLDTINKISLLEQGISEYRKNKAIREIEIESDKQKWGNFVKSVNNFSNDTNSRLENLEKRVENIEIMLKNNLNNKESDLDNKKLYDLIQEIKRELIAKWPIL